MSCCNNPVSPPPFPALPACEPPEPALSSCASASNRAFRKLPRACRKLAGTAGELVELAVGAVALAAPDPDAVAPGELVDPAPGAAAVVATAVDAGALAPLVVDVVFSAVVDEGVAELVVPAEGVGDAVPVDAGLALAESPAPPLPEPKSPMSVCNKLRNSAAIGSLPALLAPPPASQGFSGPQPGACALDSVLLAALGADPELALEVGPDEPLLAPHCGGCHQLKPLIPPTFDMPCSLTRSCVSNICFEPPNSDTAAI
jgi:hypothetical protein